MHPAIYVFAGSTVVGLAAAFILYKVSAAHFEKTQGSRGGGHGGCGHYQPEFTAQGPNADYRIVQTMVRAVEARLRKICRMKNEGEKRQAVRALLSHYNPAAFKGTDMEGTYSLVSKHIHKRLSELHLLPA